jgi:putative transposase
MARFPRVVVTGVAHHITQRGNARRQVFFDQSDRLTYLQLLAENCRTYQLRLLGYCLMSNHVHLVAIPDHINSMALALRQTHGRYAAILNGRQAASGHVWQGRYYSCPLDGAHLWAALRYVELNPVRAGLAGDASAYEWSSAGAHCGDEPDFLLDTSPWTEQWTAPAWREFLGCDAGALREDADSIRASTHTGRPLGSCEFVAGLEQRLGRRLVPRPGGRPPKVRPQLEQQAVGF